MPDRIRIRSSVDYTNEVTTQWPETIVYDSYYHDRSMEDVVSANYKERIQAGEVIINPMSFISVSKTLPDDLGGYYYAPNDVTVAIPDSASANIMRSCLGYVPQSSNLGPPPPSVDEEREADLRKQLALSFVDKPQYGFGEDLIEITDTIRFLKDPLRSLAKLMKAFDKDAIKAVSRKGRILSASRKAEAVADVWATYSFAVGPLLRSIDNALTALHDTSNLQLRRTSRSLGYLAEETTGEVTGAYVGSSFFTIPACACKAKVTRTETLDYHAGIIYDAPQRGDWKGKLGLRNKDLLVTAWEVIPLSFMVDRIVSIKNSLQSFINLVDPNVSIKGGFVTKRKEVSYTIVMTEFELGPDERWTLPTFTAYPHHHSTYTMTREKWDPSITNVLPLINPIELVNGASKVADLLALLTSALGPIIRNHYVYK